MRSGAKRFGQTGSILKNPTAWHYLSEDAFSASKPAIVARVWGDTSFDMEMAVAAGVRAIGRDSGQGRNA